MINAETMKYRYLAGLIVLANTLATVMIYLGISDSASTGPWAALASSSALISCMLLVATARYPQYR